MEWKQTDKSTQGLRPSFLEIRISPTSNQSQLCLTAISHWNLDSDRVGISGCCKIGFAGGVIDNGAELLIGEPRSNSSWVHYLYLGSNNHGKRLNSAPIPSVMCKLLLLLLTKPL